MTSPAPGHVVPGVHAEHDATSWTPVALPNVPAGHGVGATDDAGQKCPSGHVVQLDAEVALPAEPNVPAGHGCSPPATDPGGQNPPAGHGCGAGEPVGQNHPSGHMLHSAMDTDPLAGLKVPAGHGCAVGDPTWPGQKYPAGHGPRAAVADAPVAPAAHHSPGGHGEHADSSDHPPVTFPNVPAGHRWSVRGARNGLKNVPAGACAPAGAEELEPAGHHHPRSQGRHPDAMSPPGA